MTLGEAALGLALGAIIAATGAGTAAGAAREARAVLRGNDLVTAARNTLEWRLGARCASARPCPEPIVCTVTTDSSALPQGVVRVIARAAWPGGGPPAEVEFRALTEVGSCP